MSQLPDSALLDELRVLRDRSDRARDLLEVLVGRDYTLHGIAELTGLASTTVYRWAGKPPTPGRKP